ncbi:MAG: tetratricopeptide repeat protein [Armatimonadetes bacterium]|nr:tetratricopeptide repeat protein [Armatimonadota bacterium]
MSSLRISGIVLLLAFLGVAALRTVAMRREQQATQVEAAQKERVREFWNTYRKASQALATNDLQAAIPLYQAALSLKPDHEDSLYYLGNCYFQSGRYQEALSMYERLITVHPLGSSRGYMQRALVHACLETSAPFDLQKAERYFREALRVDPDSGAQMGLGEVAVLQGAWPKAWDALQVANADNAMSVAAPYLLGYLRWRADEQAEAWRWFRLAVQRVEVKKPPVAWSEEGNVKADPKLRWQALARQSVFGSHWLRLLDYVKQPDLSPSLMEREYQRLQGVLTAAQKRVRG